MSELKPLLNYVNTLISNRNMFSVFVLNSIVTAIPTAVMLGSTFLAHMQNTTGKRIISKNGLLNNQKISRGASAPGNTALGKCGTLWRQQREAPMTVKEVLQSLVDDNMVDCERIGTSNYYWAFPSKALHARKHKLEELKKQASDAKQRKVSVEKTVEKSKVGREGTKERSSLLKQLQSLREERTNLQAELEKYRECDPDVIKAMRESNVVAKEAVSRWTDNVFAIKSWTKKKFSFDDSRINKAFGIPEDFDYMD
ncbi:meiotic nuclear division protein 1 homolog isoform X1 [Xiphophorus couchianus]|uniref:meiotic nuclear division protein 1 homolog isoform X1 n=1 Tax=Xiphophorus couchianus TaxID=32473 RepID=UPI001016969C|nr:meiotic nuclear division protein 1 homolog isoform X1 [Xiphophorus couchianus]